VPPMCRIPSSFNWLASWAGRQHGRYCKRPEVQAARTTYVTEVSMNEPRPIAAYMTVKEVGELVRRDDKTIRRWIKAGKLAAYRLDGSYLISRKDLDLFLRQRWKG
jgi:excisionase family DNA binding protein